MHLVLLAEHRPEEALARAQVESALVERPPLPPEPSWYLSLHESILLRWRADVHESSAWLAQRGVEELALWFAGGILAHGASFFATQGLEVLARALGRNPEASAGWLRSALVRLSSEDKRDFARLWSKVQLEGEAALSSSERASLRSLMERLEQLVRMPLTGDHKDTLRQAARNYYKELHPERVALMNADPTNLPIHHRHPLELAHLFPEEDVNAAANLILLRTPVHTRINAVWAKLRKRSTALTAQEAERVAALIDKHFGTRWYNRTELPEDELPLLDEALEATLAELRQLFPDVR